MVQSPWPETKRCTALLERDFSSVELNSVERLYKPIRLMNVGRGGFAWYAVHFAGGLKLDRIITPAILDLAAIPIGLRDAIVSGFR